MVTVETERTAIIYLYKYIYIYIYIYICIFLLPSSFSSIREQQLHKNAASNFEQVLETKSQLYGHLPPITKTIKVRRTRHAGHHWRSRDELISDVLLWTPSYGRINARRPARTYIQHLCEDTGCSPEDLPEVMNDREEWRERVRDICTGGST